MKRNSYDNKGTSDCGLFAIAYALHITVGDDLRFLVFKQTKTRRHLVSCFQRKKLERFPSKKVVVLPRKLLANPHMMYQHNYLCWACYLPERAATRLGVMTVIKGIISSVLGLHTNLAVMNYGCVQCLFTKHILTVCAF